jgi:hypothetical protein
MKIDMKNILIFTTYKMVMCTLNLNNFECCNEATYSDEEYSYEDEEEEEKEESKPNWLIPSTIAGSILISTIIYFMYTNDRPRQTR